jgi:drug/metabolite transporter (DMT)-like permease
MGISRGDRVCSPFFPSSVNAGQHSVGFDLSVFTLGLFAALASSLCWSALDALRKKLTVKASPLWVAAWLSLLQVPLFAAGLGIQPLLLSPEYIVPGTLAAFFGGGGALLFLYAVRAGPLSLTVPCLSLTPVLSILGAFILVGERPNPLQIGGGLFVVLCAVGLFRTLPDDDHHASARRAILFMVAAAFCWAMSAGADKWSVEKSNVVTHALIQSVVGAVIFFAVWGGGKRDEGFLPRSQPGLLITTAAVFAAAFVLQLFALERLWVGSVEAPKRVIGVAGAVFLGRRVFGEIPTFQKVLWVFGMGLGALIVILAEGLA